MIRKLMRKIKIGEMILYVFVFYNNKKINANFTLEEKLKKYNLETSDLITKEILKKISTEAKTHFKY